MKEKKPSTRAGRGNARPFGNISPSGKKYRAFWSAVRPDGSQCRPSATFKTEAEAEKHLRKVQRDQEVQGRVAVGKLRVSEYLEQFLKDARHTLSPKSHQGASSLLRRHVIPYIGTVQLEKLEPSQIKSLYTKLLDEGSIKTGKGLSRQTVLLTHRALSTALKQAVSLGILTRNPCSLVKPPRVESKSLQVLDEEQTELLVRAAKGSRVELPILIAIGTGLRIGEIVGLRWKDVDLEKGVLTVNQSMEVTIGQVRFKPPKTKAGRRTLKLPKFLVEALTAYQATQAKAQEAQGELYMDHGLVVTKPNGEPIRTDSLGSTFHRIIKSTKLPQIRFHDLRHGHASHLGKRGIGLKVIQERMGHTTIAITGDIYSHLLPGMDEAAANRIDEAFDTLTKPDTSVENSVELDGKGD